MQKGLLATAALCAAVALAVLAAAIVLCLTGRTALPAVGVPVTAAPSAAAAAPSPTVPAQPLGEAADRLGQSADALAATARQLNGLKDGGTLIQLAGLGDVVRGVKAGADALADGLDELHTALDAPGDGASAETLATQAETLDRCNEALQAEIAALQAARKAQDLDAVREGLAQLTDELDEACRAAEETTAAVRGQ